MKGNKCTMKNIVEMKLSYGKTMQTMQGNKIALIKES